MREGVGALETLVEEALKRAIPQRWPRSRQSHAQEAARRLAAGAKDLLMEIARTQCINIAQAEEDLGRFTRRCAGEWRARLRERLARATGESGPRTIVIEPDERWHDIARETITGTAGGAAALEAMRASALRIAKIRTAQGTTATGAEPYSAQMLAGMDALDARAWRALETCPKWLRAEVVRASTIARVAPEHWAVEAAWRAAEAWGMAPRERDDACARRIAAMLDGWRWGGVTPPLGLVVALAREGASTLDAPGWAGAIEVWVEMPIGGAGWDARALCAQVDAARKGTEAAREREQTRRALDAIRRYAKLDGEKARAGLKRMEQEWRRIAPRRSAEPELGEREGTLCWIVGFRGPTDVLAAVRARSRPRGGLARRCERTYMGSAGVQIPVGEKRYSTTQRPEDGRNIEGRTAGTMENAVRAGLAHAQAMDA